MKQIFILTAALAAFAFTGSNNSGNMVHMEGSYVSKKGVKDPLSCYGFNVGYLTTEQGKRIAVCFDRLPDAENLTIECDPIWVEGHYEDKKIEGNGACTAGTKTILYVDRWDCY